MYHICTIVSKLFKSGNQKKIEIWTTEKPIELIESYYLLPKDKKVEESSFDGITFNYPIQSIVTLSSTHYGALKLLGVEKKLLKGVDNANYLFDDWIREAVKSENLIEVKASGELNIERLIKSETEVVTFSQQLSEKNLTLLRKMGVAALLNLEWKEHSPLGKAEWIKFFGYLCDKEEKANLLFSEVEKRYNTLKDKVSSTEEEVKILSGIGYKGNWYVPGGKSFMAQFFKDAKADYPWSDTKNVGSLNLSIEKVLSKGSDADRWINVGTVSSIKNLVESNSIYKEFKAVKNKEIYSRNKRVSVVGSNDYWQSGPYMPDVILADLIKICYPTLLNDHKLYFYQKVN